jgi:two-component system sensor histidine kinase BaeS
MGAAMKLNLRGRLLAGHILPVLLLIPLVGLALITLLETRIIIPALASEMIDQGLLIGKLAEDTPRVWINPAEAQVFLLHLPLQQPTTVELLSPSYVIVATSGRDKLGLIGSLVKDLPAIKTDGSPSWGITAGEAPNEQILNVLISVVTSDGHVIGLLRIYRRLTDIESGLTDMRLLILIVLLVGLAISGLTAILLAESVSRPLKKLAAAIQVAPLEGQAPQLSEGGFAEVRAISHAYNRLQERRHELEDTRQRMLANVVHEIGRPLGSLRAAVHALQAGAAQDPQLTGEMLKGMTERLQRMGGLLEDLSLTYRGLNPKELNLRPVDLCGWLEQLTPLWAEAARQKGVEWQAVVAPDLPDLLTDPERLSQALGNLVDNALKFTPPGGKVILAVQAGAGKVQFRVSDTGPGIAPEDQIHLFTPFYRPLRPGWKAPGLGLGLSIARSIADTLGGEIQLESVPGQGSTFTLVVNC